MKQIPLLCAAGLLCLSLNASGASVVLPNPSFGQIPVPNFSFEQDSSGGMDTTVSTGAAGWTGNDWVFTMNPNEVAFPGAMNPGVPTGGDGPQSVIFWFSSFLQSAAPLAEAIVGATYSLTVAIGDRAIGDEPEVVRIGFLLNDAFVPSGDISFNAADYSPEGTFSDFTFQYTAQPEDAGKALKIYLGHTTIFATNWVHMDNVRLTVIPEPSAALFGIGAAAGMLLRRKRHTA